MVINCFLDSQVVRRESMSVYYIFCGAFLSLCLMKSICEIEKASIFYLSRTMLIGFQLYLDGNK